MAHDVNEKIVKGKKDLETKALDPKKYVINSKTFKGKKAPTIVTKVRANIYSK